MQNFINLAIDILEKDLLEIDDRVDHPRLRRELSDDEKESIKKTKLNINNKIYDLKNGIVSVSYDLKNPIHTTNILNTYINHDLSWFGSSNSQDFEESSLTISEIFNISLYDSLRVLVFSNNLMTLETKLNMEPRLKKILIEKGSSSADNYRTAEEISKEIELVENKLLFIINKKLISSKDYAHKYIQLLELDIGYSTAYDNFLDWLLRSEDYGVISSFCESDWEDYGQYRMPFEIESIERESFV